jgi:hypothetical protein
MTTIAFLINLAGATMLLLFAVRMMQTGIERSMGPSFKRLVSTRKDSRLQTAFAGVILAIILQSATAVALLASGFASSGILTFVGGLSLVLGADLGSALVIQILSFKLDWLIPLLLAIGGWLFLKVGSRRAKQFGRILMGVAFILLALRLIGSAMEVSSGPHVPAQTRSDHPACLEECGSRQILGRVSDLPRHQSRLRHTDRTSGKTSCGGCPAYQGSALQPGIDVNHEAVRYWRHRFGPMFAA